MKTFTIQDGKKLLIYRMLKRKRSDGIVAELVGYSKNGVTHVYDEFKQPN